MPGLDDLLSGAATVGKTALQVPQAVGGGALDILIGDRTNVPVGEQVKRSIEALLIAGENPAALIGVHNMNAQRNAQAAAIVNSPDFRRTLSVQQTVKNLTPEDAFEATAQLYGIKGYRPPMASEAVDAAPGGPSLPERQNVPQLPPLSRASQVDDIVQGTQLGAMTRGSDLDQLLARYRGAGLDAPIDVQQGAADAALAGSAEPGASKITRKWNGRTLAVEVQDLAPDAQFFAGDGAEERAFRARDARQEWYRSIGDPTEVGLITNPTGTAYTLKEVVPAEAAAAAGAAGRVRGEAIGKDSPTGAASLGGKSPRQRETDAATVQAQREYDAKVAPFLKLVDKMEANLTALPEKGGGIPGAIGARLQGALGEALPQAFPEQRALTEAGDAAAVMITDLYGGKGAQSDRDIKLMTGQVPRVGVHTRPIGQSKLQELRNAVASRRPGGASAKSTARTSPADEALNAAFLR